MKRKRVVEFRCTSGRWAAFRPESVDAIEELDDGSALIVSDGGNYTVPGPYAVVVDRVWPALP